MLENQNLVTHNHTHQRDESKDRGKSQGTVHQSKTYQCPRNHQGQCNHTDSGYTILLEIEQQEEEHDDHRNGNTTDNLRHSLVAIFYLAAHLRAYALRQLDILLHDAGYLLFNRSGIDTLGKLGRHRDTALTTTMHDATLAPLGLHLCYLAQRHRGVS